MYNKGYFSDFKTGSFCMSSHNFSSPKRMSSRAIKQEMLDTMLPEIYVGPAAGSRRRAVKRERKPKVGDFVKIEPGVDLKRIDVKQLTRKIKRKKRGSSEASLSDDLEIIGATAPRRPYQWKGRRVRRVLRPGTVVSFTPGQRSGTRAKREYDEVMADESLLEDLEAGTGEFRYGKRGRYEPLDTSNPTPSMKPVTGQFPLVMPGQATLLPTVQVMAPRKRRFKDDPEEAFDVKRRIKTEDVKPLVQVEDIKVRAPKRVAPGVEVHTVDISVPTDVDIKPAPAGRVIAVARKRRAAAPAAAAVKLETMDVDTKPVVAPVAPSAVVSYGPANKIFPKYWQHPSQKLLPPVSALPRVRRRRRARRSKVSVGANIIPRVVYHPSIKLPARRRPIRV